MSWRVQKDDPIEKCREAQESFVWVIFKKARNIDSDRPILCFYNGVIFRLVYTHDMLWQYSGAIDRLGRHRENCRSRKIRVKSGRI